MHQKRDNSPPNGVTCAEPRISKPTLRTQPTRSFSLSRDCDLSWSVWNDLVSTREVTCQKDPAVLHTEEELPETSPSCSCSSCPDKTCISSSPGRGRGGDSLLLLEGTLPVHGSSDEASQVFTCTQLGLGLSQT